MRGQKNFLIVISRLALRFHVEESELAVERAHIEISLGRHVRVIPARPDRPRLKRVLAAAVRGDERRSFFLGAVHVGSDELSMPVDKFRHVGVVVHIDGDALAFAKAQDGSRNFAVVSDRLDHDCPAQFRR